ncbi:AAA family ATPase [Herbaspirillum sp. RV1423]|uniref:AAA family ATPase n=1 Tax=Herbaspirillum sp. RV1423 TaxID=1443993 RepID=UPI0004BC238D|nr:AAA family ATPase [Herbaspirillum sp. RV1423]
MDTPKKNDGIILNFANEIMLQAMSWLWRFWIALGKVHLLVGDPGSGKTTLLADLLAAFSTGGLLPDGERAPKVFCLYWPGEESIEDTVAVRLKAAGANLRNIIILRGVAEHGCKRSFQLSDLPILVNKIKQLRAQGIDVRVIAIDPLLMGSGNSNSNDNVRRLLDPLRVLAEEESIAIIGVRHLSKASAKKKLADRINGSVAISALCRLAMFVIKIAGTGTSPDNPTRGVVVRAKTNIGPVEGGFAFTIAPTSIEVEGGTADSTTLKWDADSLTGDPESIVRTAESNAGASIDNDLTGEIRFLQDMLERGPVHSNEVLALGKEEGFTPDRLRQALVTLGGNSGKEPGRPRGPWYWWLPETGFDDRRDRPYDGDRYPNRHDDNRRTASRQETSTQGYGRLHLHPRNEGRFDDYSEKMSKDEKHGKVEKSANPEHDRTPRWSPQIDFPGNGDDDLAGDPVGV